MTNKIPKSETQERTEEIFRRATELADKLGRSKTKILFYFEKRNSGHSEDYFRKRYLSYPVVFKGESIKILRARSNAFANCPDEICILDSNGRSVFEARMGQRWDKYSDEIYGVKYQPGEWENDLTSEYRGCVGVWNK